MFLTKEYWPVYQEVLIMFFLYYGFALLALFFTVPRWLFFVVAITSALAIYFSRRYNKTLKTPINKFRI